MLLGALTLLAASLSLRAYRMDANTLASWSHAEMDSLFFALAARADSLDKVGTPAEYILWTAPDEAAADTVDFPIDINQATSAELQHLPRIGPAMAQRILGERQRLGGAFTSVNDLLLVRGIGEKTLEKLRDLVTVDSDPPLPDSIRSAAPRPDSTGNAGRPP